MSDVNQLLSRQSVVGGHESGVMTERWSGLFKVHPGTNCH